MAQGEAHYREEYLLAELMTAGNGEVGDKAGITLPETTAMSVSDPTAIQTLLTEGAQLSEVSQPLKWIAFLMALYYHGLALSVIGKWCGVHKTTVLRWILGATYQLWPIVSQWLRETIGQS